VSWAQRGLERGRNSLGGLGLSSRQALERGEDSPKGASSPRARRRFARGCVKPSTEAKISWCGAWPSSEMEVRPRGVAAGYLMGR
jgi:hypothetical protein